MLESTHYRNFANYDECSRVVLTILVLSIALTTKLVPSVREARVVKLSKVTMAEKAAQPVLS